MTNREKNKISDQLRKKKETSGMSDRELANAIGNFSGSAVNHITKNRWEDKPQLVSDESFRKVASWLGVPDEWNINYQDDNYKKVQSVCKAAKEDSDSFAVSAAPGFSKSVAASDFAASARNVYYIKCKQHLTRKAFLADIMQAMGMTQSNDNACDMCAKIVEKLNNTAKPLLILDEADKLHDNLFQFFITFYNDTYMSCGFVFLGSIFFKLRVLKGVNKNRQGYAEFYSRVGKEFIVLKDLNQRRVTEICHINGLTGTEDITAVYNDSQNDLRRVKRLVESIKKKKSLMQGSQLSIINSN